MPGMWPPFHNLRAAGIGFSGADVLDMERILPFRFFRAICASIYHTRTAIIHNTTAQTDFSEVAMADDPDLTGDIEENAAAPRRIDVDGTVAEQHSLRDQIAADRYLKGAKAVENPTRGLRFTKIKPPGA